MRLIILAALCAAICGCSDERAVVQLPAVELPLLDATVATVRTSDYPLVLTIRADGSLYSGTRPTTLAELPRKESVGVRLRIDLRAPWAHVQWIVAQLLLPPGRHMGIGFSYRSATGEEVLLGSSAGDIGMCWTYSDPPPPRLGMHLFVYQKGRVRCGKRFTYSPRSACAWLRAAKARAKRESLVSVWAELEPSPSAPWEQVAQTYAHIRAEGIKRLTIRGHVLAPESARNLQRLPAPDRIDSAPTLRGFFETGFYDNPYIELKPVEPDEPLESLYPLEPDD